MMRFRQILNEETGEMLISFTEEGDIEFVNPFEYLANFFITRKMIMSGVPIEELKGEKNPTEASTSIFRNAMDSWVKEKVRILKTELPDSLIKLLQTNKKSEQEKLIKSFHLTPAILMAFAFRAYIDFGFTLSMYQNEITPNGIDSSKMPYASLINEKGEVEKFGKTELSDGQIKQIIQHRKVTVARIFDNRDTWHCFFANYRSLNGDEIWLGKNQPHFHYISKAFGISRQELINELKSTKYNLGNVPHLKLLDYGKQPE
jgi:hypothetical protein